MKKIMDNEKKDQLLALLQIESQHRQRIDSIWTQFNDSMLVIHGLVFAVLASLITVPDLNANGRIFLVAFTVFLDMAVIFGSRRETEKAAAEVQNDYAADYYALMGVAPPRLLYSRALKMKKQRLQNKGGTSLLPANRNDLPDARQDSAIATVPDEASNTVLSLLAEDHHGHPPSRAD